jgi:hypothetical protein
VNFVVLPFLSIPINKNKNADCENEVEEQRIMGRMRALYQINRSHKPHESTIKRAIKFNDQNVSRDDLDTDNRCDSIRVQHTCKQEKIGVMYVTYNTGQFRFVQLGYSNNRNFDGVGDDDHNYDGADLERQAE